MTDKRYLHDFTKEEALQATILMQAYADQYDELPTSINCPFEILIDEGGKLCIETDDDDSFMLNDEHRLVEWVHTSTREGFIDDLLTNWSDLTPHEKNTLNDRINTYPLSERDRLNSIKS